MAPEVLRDQGYDNKCDIFGLGSLFYNLISGKFLFKAKNKLELLKANRMCDVSKVLEDYKSALSP